MVSKSQPDKILQTYYVVENGGHSEIGNFEDALAGVTNNGSGAKRNLQEALGLT
jgi:hypothetical protein